MRRRLLRLLEPAPRDRRRAAAVALACVGVLGLFSVTQEASRAEGEVQVARRSSDAESEAASDRDASESTASDHLAETVASIDRIWEEQTHPIHSGRAVVRVLRMSSLKDPVQQGHELAQMSRLEVDAFLDSIDFVNDPNCLRKVRDGLLVGSLILDQPAFKTNEIAWNKSARRLSWSNGRTLVYDGEAFIQHDPNRRQVDLYAAPPYAWFGDQSAQEMWQKLISLNYGMRDLARRPALQKAQTLDDGSRRLTFEANSTRREFGDINSLNWVIGGDGKLQSIELSFQYHVIRQFGFQPYGRNVVVPQVSIDAEYSGWTPAGDHEILLGLTVSVIEEAEFNTEIPQDVFRVAVPANTAVWDRRTELKLRAAEVATEDVLTLFER
jgi:hypothetical protein